MDLYIKTCNKYQQFKNRKTIYGNLPTNIISALKWCNLVHIDLVGPYTKSIRQQNPGDEIINKYVRLTSMTMIDTATGWFDIFYVPWFKLEQLSRGNIEYIYKLSARISQLLYQTWLCRYPRPTKIMFDNCSKFKQDFTTLIKDFDITTIWKYIKNPQYNSPADLIQQVI